MKYLIAQKITIAGLGLAWILVLGVTVFSYWSWTEYAREPTLLLWIAIANSIATILLGGVSYIVMRAHNRAYQTEEALQQSEKRFKIALKNSPTIVFHQDTDLRYTWIYNHASWFDTEEVIGKQDTDILPQEDAQRLTGIKRRVLESGVGMRVETFVTINGEIRYYDLTVEPLQNPDGEIIGITCASTDITEQKQIEEALFRSNEELETIVAERTAALKQANHELVAEIVERKQIEDALKISEERFRLALQNSPTVVFTQNCELRYTWSYLGSFGRDSQLIVGKLDAEIMPSQDAEKITVIKRQVLETGEGVRQEICATINGTIQYWDLHIEPLFGSDGSIVGITGAATNITELRTNTQLLRSIFNDSLDAILIADDLGNYIKVNPAACELFGLPSDELLSKNISDFMPPNFDFELAWQTFQEKGQLKGEIRLLRPDGTV